MYAGVGGGSGRITICNLEVRGANSASRLPAGSRLSGTSGAAVMPECGPPPQLFGNKWDKSSSRRPSCRRTSSLGGRPPTETLVRGLL
jgi:hypothetical protein